MRRSAEPAPKRPTHRVRTPRRDEVLGSLLGVDDEFGRYRIDERIATGGMGEVYRASVTTVGGVTRPVAIKVVRSDLAGQGGFAQLFVDEVRVAMALSHGNIVQAFDVGQIDQHFFLAMEYVDGMDLSRLLGWRRHSGRGALPTSLALLIAIEALKGLDYAHRRKGTDGAPLIIVHRDVSPGNLLLSREGEVKVADFGVAKSTLRDVGSVIGTLKGKIPYMPPEQVRGGSVDRRADIYSLGAVLYEMIAGQRLFSGDGAALIPYILSGPGEALDALRGAPVELVRILKRGLAPDVDVRYSTAAQMRHELERLAHEERFYLSSAELADQVEEALAAQADPDSGFHTMPGMGGVPADPLSSVPPSAFDQLLGKELRRLDEDTSHSVYTTRSGRGSVDE